MHIKWWLWILASWRCFYSVIPPKFSFNFIIKNYNYRKEMYFMKVTHPSWLESTSLRDVDSNRNQQFKKQLSDKGFGSPTVSCNINCFTHKTTTFLLLLVFARDKPVSPNLSPYRTIIKLWRPISQKLLDRN